MLIALTMPQFGESITQARLVRWLVSEGSSIKENEPLVEMETEKSVFSYESPFQGKLVRVLEKEDVEVPVGKEIAHFEVSDEQGEKYLKLGIGRRIGKETKSSSSTSTTKTNPTPTLSQKAAPASSSSSSVSPLIRSLAKEQGVSLEEVARIPGTGPGGRVTKDDFLNYIKKKTPAASSPAQPTSSPVTGAKTVNVTPIRARIAERMSFSKTTIPHAGTSVDVDLSQVEKARKEQKDAPGYFIVAVQAVIQALQKNPLLNSSWKEDAGKKWIEQYESIHLGLAVATEKGLLVPVLRNAHSLSFTELTRQIEQLVWDAKRGALPPMDLMGATFTVNNTGALGAVRSMQIIPAPQAAILALNRVAKRAWVVEDRVEVRPIMSLDLAFDHRVIDGDQAVKFLLDVKENLEKWDASKIR